MPIFFLLYKVNCSILLLRKASLHNTLFSPLCLQIQVNCSIRLVETIPEGLSYNGSTVQTLDIYSAWKRLLGRTEARLEIASSYWTLRQEDVGVRHKTAWKGEDIYNSLMEGKRGT